MSIHSLDRFVLSRKLSDQEKKMYKIIAKRYLEYFGNKTPSCKQLTVMQDLLFNVWLKWGITFDQRLTDREKECLYYASHGKSIKEIAYLLAITEDTVKAHRKSIVNKLACKNLYQAIAIGIKFGCLA